MTPAPERCPLCAAENPRHREALPGDARYDLFECGACEVQFWWPLKNPGASWYEHDARYADRNNDPILAPNEKHLEVVKNVTPAGTVLDIGCGVGNFLSYAIKNGWKGSGIDFDQDAIEAGKRTFGLNSIEVADLRGFRQKHPAERFDLVTFFDVFEHLDDHTSFVEGVRALLVPGGKIALSVPYRHGWRWLMPHDLPPRHLTRWDERSISTFFRRHGFGVRLVRRLPVSVYYIALKLRFRYGKSVSFGAVGKVKARAKASAMSTDTLRIKVLHFLAKAKDLLIFGAPATLLWLLLLPTRARYTDMLVVFDDVSR